MRAFALYAALLVFLVSGCATMGNESLKDESVIQAIKAGQTKEEVQQLLGKPWTVSQSLMNGRMSESWGYLYAYAQLFSPAQSRVITITFDADGRVSGFSRTSLAR